MLNKWYKFNRIFTNCSFISSIIQRKKFIKFIMFLFNFYFLYYKYIISINMFNYWAYDDANCGSGDNINMSDPRIQRGINVYNWNNNTFRDLRFYPSGVKSQDNSTPSYYNPYTGQQVNLNGRGVNQLHSINNYTGGHSGATGNQNTPVPMQGIVQSQLYDASGNPKNDGTGYPYLAYGSWQGSAQQVGYNPQFSAGNTAASLQYLFDPNTEAYGKTSYTGVNYLFYDQDGYYTYDSKL